MKKCDLKAYFRYTWPGNDEAVCCSDHMLQLKKVADAIGIHLQMVPLSEEDLSHHLKCTSNISGRAKKK